jgi:hypothetical protein
VRRRTLVAGASAGLALAGAASALAVPPGGAVDKLGSPAGSLEITSAGLREGKVQFCVRGFVIKDGSAPQQFQVKLDDFGIKGIGQFQPDATGTYCGEIATDRAAYASKASADDKIPAVALGADANLCDQTKQHWLRVLTGTWAHPNGSERSIARDITIDGTCGTGGKAAAPSVGTVVGGDTGVLPPTTTPGGTTTTPGGTTTTPGTPTTPTTTTPVVLSGLAKVRSSTVAVKGSIATLEVRRTAAVGRGTITIRSASKLTVKGRKGAKVRTLVSGRPYSLTGEVSQSLRLKLTTTGKSVLRTRKRLSAVVTITPTGGTPTTAKVVLEPAQTTKK